MTLDRNKLARGMVDALHAARVDMCNRWACNTCFVCGTIHKTEVCLIGVCPECWRRICAVFGEPTPRPKANKQ